MSYSELRNWPIFSLLEPNFVATIQMVLVYGKSGDEALIVTKDQMVYGLGCNIAGCLGTGDVHSTLYPKKIDVLCGKGIKTFAYGTGLHVLALTHKGKVYSWGNYNLKINQPFDNPSYNTLPYDGLSNNGSSNNGSPNNGLTPTLVGMPLCDKVVVDIACGSHHSLALTDEGEVYAWGQNNYGQLGSNVNRNQSVPRKVNSALTGSKVVSITCGETYSMVVTSNGEVYGWGYNEVGQLGNGNHSNQLNPCKVASLAGVVIEKVACGYGHTLALSDEGVLYVWGSNSYGELGLGHKTSTTMPTKLTVPEMGRVSEIATLHYSHISVAIGEENTVFMWGQCRGQSITVPTATPLAHLHDALACYAIPSAMHRPLFLYTGDEMTIAKHLKQAFDDPTTSDLTIQVEGNPIHVHKAVLKIRCQYFKTMFQTHWAENKESVIQHDQFSYIVYKSFLKYLYTDEVDLPPENALELLDLANAYFETQLKKRCAQIIKQGITVLNVVSLYRTAIEYNAQELEEFCFKFALNRMTAVIQTPDFAKLDESTVKAFIIKAAQAGAFKT